MTNENLNKKTFSVYSLSFGQPNYFYNEDENRFFYQEPTKATLYTEQEANVKRRELLKPRIEHYQQTGEHYSEIHIGDLFKKKILQTIKH